MLLPNVNMSQSIQNAGLYSHFKTFFWLILHFVYKKGSMLTLFIPVRFINVTCSLVYVD